MCYQHGAAGPWKVVTLIAGSKRRSLLMAGDDDVTPKTTEQYLIVLCDKSFKIDMHIQLSLSLHFTYFITVVSAFIE